MPPLASEFGGFGGAILLGCAILVFFPVLCVCWLGLQLRSLWIGDRLPIVLLLLMLLFAAAPAYFVVKTFPQMNQLGGYTEVVFFLSMGGLLLQPVILVREFLKFLRDRPRPARKDRRPQRQRAESEDRADGPEDRFR